MLTFDSPEELIGSKLLSCDKVWQSKVQITTIRIRHSCKSTNFVSRRHYSTPIVSDMLQSQSSGEPALLGKPDLTQ